MDTYPINMGQGTYISAGEILAIVTADSAPVKRTIQHARERGFLINATYGRKTRSVIITKSNHVVLSSLHPETIANRLLPAKQEQG